MAGAQGGEGAEAMVGRMLGRLIALQLAGAALPACAVLTPLPAESDLAARLARFPTEGLPLEKPVTIHWNAQQVPFIEAGSDADLAAALGLVHAHLRLGQMELMRRISRGRIAEMVGPIATDVDHALRILGFARAVPAILETMPTETKAWLEAFVCGVNFYQAHAAAAGRLPHEYAVLALDLKPWTVEDVLAVGRLASPDVNWLVWFSLLKLRGRDDWPELWARVVDEGSASLPSFAGDGGPARAALERILMGLGRTGSNSLAVSGARTASGAAMIANDPHLGIMLPNLWLIAGYKSPSYHAVGLMIPGVPFIALGRNPWIAWGGTNMRAASSDLFDVSALDPAAVRAREERIAVRWWPDRSVTLRETDLGPVISDAPLLEAGDGVALALKWLGHGASDEVTAMLGVNRAGNFAEFVRALDGFAVPAQNMVYADAEGHVGQAMAVRLPRRANGRPADLVLDPAAGAAPWHDFVTAMDLPIAFDPPEGFVASANNKPAPASVPVGWFFSPDDRIRRLQDRLAAADGVGVDDLAAIQRDVVMPSSLALRDAIVARAESLELVHEARRLIATLAEWDGAYAEDSAGAVAFEVLLHHLALTLYDDERRTAYRAASRLREVLRADVAAAPAATFEAALARAAADAARFPAWGDMHRLRLAHPLARIPLIGARYRFGDDPAAGGSQTVMKTAHSLTAERHAANYGSQARHISDMADPDANWFVLLGGQDGWFRSSTFNDQYALWRRGDYVQVPLRPETVRATFPHRTILSP